MLKNKFFLISCLVVSLFVFAAPFTSGSPDGLTAALEDLEVAIGEEDALIPSVMPDYEIPSMDSPLIGKFISGLSGLLITFLCVLLITSNRNKNSSKS
ncbi:PDGLE domain-containing protein [candidate division KSB1 bacterium]